MLSFGRRSEQPRRSRRATCINSVRFSGLMSLEKERADSSSFAVLAIYLDPAEPTNIVEAYTFTFTYETDAMGNKVSSGCISSDRHPCSPLAPEQHPELVVRDQFKGMVISSTGTSSSTSSSKKRVLKEGEAKRQVQSMIKK